MKAELEDLHKRITEAAVAAELNGNKDDGEEDLHYSEMAAFQAAAREVYDLLPVAEQQDAELSRLRAELAIERRAVERLATMLHLRGACPPGRYGSPECTDKSDGNCRACLAAWARSKEASHE